MPAVRKVVSVLVVCAVMAATVTLGVEWMAHIGSQAPGGPMVDTRGAGPTPY